MTRTFTPTDEQLACVTAATETKDNLLISALAGAAKTSTLELIAQALPGVNALCLAFNKRIADEMRDRLPPNYTVKTLNALGHSVWGQTLGQRLRLNKGKVYNLLADHLSTQPPRESDILRENFSTLLRAVGDLKTTGWIPEDYLPSRAKHKPEPLLTDEEAFAWLDEEPTDLEWSCIRAVYSASLDEAFEGSIDFADQLLMPTVFRAVYPIFSLILVDEAQDLSALNHRMLTRLTRRRIIAVGDQCQAIYGFRGAHEDGMEALRAQFSMKELRLSCSFRCPPAIVSHVQWRAPHMTAWPGNPHPGEVNRLAEWSVTDIPDKTAVICRNNAPLFSLAVQFLSAGRYAKLWGNDIAAGLTKVLENLGPRAMLEADAHAALDDWIEINRRKSRNKGRFDDKALCLRIVIQQAETLGGAINYLNTLLTAEGSVQLMTGHKAKGFEFDDVFFLNEQLVGSDGQDPNLRYVICTRAKRSLTYIASEDQFF